MGRPANRIIYHRDGTTSSPRSRVRRIDFSLPARRKVARLLLEILVDQERVAFDFHDFEQVCGDVVPGNPATRFELQESRMRRRLDIMRGKNRQDAARWFVHKGQSRFEFRDEALEWIIDPAGDFRERGRDRKLISDFRALRRRMLLKETWKNDRYTPPMIELWDIVLGRFWAEHPFGGTLDDLIAVIETVNASHPERKDVGTGRTSVAVYAAELCQRSPAPLERLERGIYRAVHPEAAKLVRMADRERGRISVHAWADAFEEPPERGVLIAAHRELDALVSRQMLLKIGNNYTLPVKVRQAVRDAHDRAAMLLIEEASRAEEEGDPEDVFERAALLVMEDAERPPNSLERVFKQAAALVISDSKTAVDEFEWRQPADVSSDV